MNRVGPMENWDHFMDRCPKEISNAVIMKDISRVTSLSKTKVEQGYLWGPLMIPKSAPYPTLHSDQVDTHPGLGSVPKKNKILPIVAVQDFAPKLQRLVFKS